MPLVKRSLDVVFQNCFKANALADAAQTDQVWREVQKCTKIGSKKRKLADDDPTTPAKPIKLIRAEKVASDDEDGELVQPEAGSSASDNMFERLCGLWGGDMLDGNSAIAAFVGEDRIERY